MSKVLGELSLITRKGGGGGCYKMGGIWASEVSPLQKKKKGGGDRTNFSHP